MMSSQPSPTPTHSDGAKTFFESFHVVNAYHRLLGYSFLSRQILPDDDPGRQDVVCKRWSPYAVYAVTSWVVLITVFAYDSYEVLKMFDDSESIEKAVTLAYSDAHPHPTGLQLLGHDREGSQADPSGQ
ncbi:hypothetical protein MTO96_024928 [Rhipicephalus appendiculatus]